MRDALRSLRAAPLLSAVAGLSLALGIGANTAIFSILNSLLLRALPVRDPQALVLLRIGEQQTSWTNPLWEQIRAHAGVFDGAFAWGTTRFDLASSGPSDFVRGIFASGGFFDVLGVPAVVGRTFGPGDDRRGGGPGGPVAVISDEFWRRHFGGARDVVGRTLTLDRVPFTIVGVTGRGFLGPDVGRGFDVAVPIGTEPLIRGSDTALDQRSYWWLSVMARRKPGQTLAQAEAALRGLQPQIRAATMPTDWRPDEIKYYLSDAFGLDPASTGPSYLRDRYQRPLEAMMVVVGLVLLIACANIANLLLARATARRRELSIRLALGASRLRLARQLLAESLLLSGLGAAAGLVLARWGSALLVQQLSTRTSTVVLDLALDWRVLGFTAAAAVGTAVLFGTAPALRAARVEPGEALKEQGRGVVGGGRLWLGQTLIVLQVALSLVLVVAAGLFVHTFSTLVTRDLGFDPNPVLVVNVDALRTRTQPADRADLYERVRRTVEGLPGVASAAASVVTPVSGSTWMFTVTVPDGLPVPAGSSTTTYVNQITPDWFSTYGTPIVAGRDFDARDRAGAPAVAIVNQTFVRTRIGTGNPIGRRIERPGSPSSQPPPLEIVGVVADAVYRSLRDPAPPTMYVPIAQVKEPSSAASLSVRAAGGSPAQLTRSITAAIAGVDPDLTLTFRTLTDMVGASLVQERVVALLSGFFGALALLLAGLGLYGVTAYTVSRRRTEMGIRLALGAQPRRVLRLVLRRVALLVAAGVAAGALVSVWAGRFVSTLLYGLTPRDPATLIGAALVLLLVGAAAGWAPARRAARTDPASVLREG
jgi:putative ABC transport system permease protein